MQYKMYRIINNWKLDLVMDCSCIKGLVHVFSCPTAMILLAEEDTSSIVDVSIGRTVDGYCGIMFIRGGQYSKVAKLFLVRGKIISPIATCIIVFLFCK